MVLDIEEIQTQFNKVILHSQNYDEVNTDRLFEKWYASKKWFIDAIGGKLIYEVPEKISFEIDNNERERRVAVFVDEIATMNSYLARFVHFNRNNFYENITKEDYCYNGVDVPKGMKISRAFKLFEKDKEMLNRWQTKMSMILQENKIEGTLCFSVHPLDFLSSSENTYNWRSCHALDGEYRSGNLSYMLDESTIMCYLKGDKKAILPDFPEDVPWNNKKWRMLLFFSDTRTALFAGRQYPFFNRGVLDTVLDKIYEARIIKHRRWSEWSNYSIDKINYGLDRCGYENSAFLNHNYVGMRYNLVPIDEIVIDPGNPLHFNDLLKSSCYKPYYTWFNHWSASETKEIFHIGADVPCLRCGENHINISSSFLCDKDELKYGNCEDEDLICYCACCDERLFIEDDTTYRLRDGEYVCQSCLDNKCTLCECCDEYVWNSQIIYDAVKDRYVCDECYYD